LIWRAAHPWPPAAAARNHIASLPGFTRTYDSNGNVLNDSLHQYTWDSEGKPATIDTTSLTFDALGRTVEFGSGSSYTQVIYGPTGGKLALMSGQNLLKARIHLPGGGTATYTSSGLAFYSHADWLGSARFFSTPSQTMYGDVAYAPFGETYAQAGSTDISFTGQISDTAGGNFDFLYREYNNQGRWASPDPAGLAAADLTDPQAWNRYTYVRNSPCELSDPLGLDHCDFVVSVSGLGGPRLAAVEHQINSIFGQLGDESGNTVGITFTSGGSRDYSLVYENSPWYYPSSRGGKTACFPGVGCWGPSSVYLDNIVKNIEYKGPSQDADLNAYLSLYGAHELGHQMFNSFLHSSDPGNLMQVDGGAGWLSPDQVGQLFKTCQKLHPPNKSGESGGGGGGGAGGGDPTSYFGGGSAGLWVLANAQAFANWVGSIPIEWVTVRFGPMRVL
jgi:RHS repeat-associated protein